MIVDRESPSHRFCSRRCVRILREHGFGHPPFEGVCGLVTHGEDVPPTKCCNCGKDDMAEAKRCQRAGKDSPAVCGRPATRRATNYWLADARAKFGPDYLMCDEHAQQYDAGRVFPWEKTVAVGAPHRVTKRQARRRVVVKALQTKA